uniref:RNA helicase n=1 Tax=Caenorhabditis tropicalis TaxID=1561998 RepID=A0A1I7T2L0_9PELO
MFRGRGNNRGGRYENRVGECRGNNGDYQSAQDNNGGRYEPRQRSPSIDRPGQDRQECYRCSQRNGNGEERRSHRGLSPRLENDRLGSSWEQGNQGYGGQYRHQDREPVRQHYGNEEQYRQDNHRERGNTGYRIQNGYQNQERNHQNGHYGIVNMKSENFLIVYFLLGNGGQGHQENHRERGNTGYRIQDGYQNQERNRQNGHYGNIGDNYRNSWDQSSEGIEDDDDDIPVVPQIYDTSKTLIVTAPSRNLIGYIPTNQNIGNESSKMRDQLKNMKLSEDQFVEVVNSDWNACLKEFEEAGLHPTVLRNLRKLAHLSPRPIQSMLIPQIQQGYDVIAQAETGGGKTAAFALPIIDSIMKMTPEEKAKAKKERCPLALILTPTRELTNQVFEFVQRYCAETGVSVSRAFGEIDNRSYNSQFTSECDILVACCGKVMYLLGQCKINLHRLKYIVLDEADRLLLDPLKETSENNQNFASLMESYEMQDAMKKAQVILTSTTFPAQVEDIAAKYLKVLPNHQQAVRVRILGGGKLNRRVTVQFHRAKGLIEKKQAMKEIWNGEEEDVKTLYFTNDKKILEQIYEWMKSQETMKEIGRQRNAYSMSSDINQQARECRFGFFKNSPRGEMVTTDVLARGIDVPDLKRVVQFDLPEGHPDEVIDTIIHRCGRTGRVEEGTAIIFIDDTKEKHRNLVPLLIEVVENQGRGHSIPCWMREIAKEFEEQNENKCVSDNSEDANQGEVMLLLNTLIEKVEAEAIQEDKEARIVLKSESSERLRNSEAGGYNGLYISAIIVLLLILLFSYFSSWLFTSQ